MQRVVFSHDEGDDHLFLHQFRNFGEAIWHEFREEERVRVSLDEIDACINSFEIQVKASMLNRVLKTCKLVRSRHLMENRVRIETSDKCVLPDH